MALSRFTRATLLMAAGPIVWAVHFAVIYGFAALACARGFAAATFWLVVAATIISATAMVLIVVASLAGARAPERAELPPAFAYWVSFALAAIALLGVIWEALPVLVVPPCG